MNANRIDKTVEGRWSKWKGRVGFRSFHYDRMGKHRYEIPFRNKSRQHNHISLLSFILYHQTIPFTFNSFLTLSTIPPKHSNSRFSASFIELKTLISVRIRQQEWYNQCCLVLTARIESKWHATVNLMSTFERQRMGGWRW